MSAESEYFIARGRSVELIEAYFEARDAHRDAFWKLGRDLGASIPAWQGSWGYGWGFDTPPSTDAVREDPKNPGFWIANRKTKAGRDLAAAVKALPRPPVGLVNTFWPRRFFGGIPTGPYGKRGQPHSGVGVEKLGDDWVIEVPIPYGEKTAPVPPDAAPLLRSEYWRRREQADAPARSTP